MARLPVTNKKSPDEKKGGQDTLSSWPVRTSVKKKHGKEKRGGLYQGEYDCRAPMRHRPTWWEGVPDAAQTNVHPNREGG